jgi:hypothetical protein
MDLEGAEIPVNPSSQVPHALYMMYDDSVGFMAIDGNNIIKTKTHNRNLANMRVQQYYGTVMLNDRVMRGKTIVYQHTKTGDMINEIMGFDTDLRGIVQNTIKDITKEQTDYSVKVSTGINNQNINIRVRDMSLGFGSLSGQEKESLLLESPFFLIGYDCDIRLDHLNYLSIGIHSDPRIMVVNYNTIPVRKRIDISLTDLVVSDHIDINLNFLLNDNNDLEFTSRIGYLGNLGNILNKINDPEDPKNHMFVNFPMSNLFLNAGLNHRYLIDDIFLNTYSFVQYRLDLKSMNHQRRVLAFDTFVLGQLLEIENNKLKISINPEFTKNISYVGGRLGIEAGLDNLSFSMDSGFEISTVKPWYPDNINFSLRANQNIENISDTEFWVGLEYEKEFWPFENQEDLTFSIGIKDRL